MPRSKKNGKKTGDGNSGIAPGRFTPMESEQGQMIDSQDASPSNAKTANELRKGGQSSAKKTSLSQSPRPLVGPTTAQGGEQPRMDFGLSGIIRTAKEDAAANGSMNDPKLASVLGPSLPTMDLEYASTIGKPHTTTPNEGLVELEGADAMGNLNAKPNSSMASNSSPSGPMTSWSRHHGVEDTRRQTMTIEPPQFDPLLEARFAAIDPRSPIAPQMVHLTTPQNPGVSVEIKHDAGGELRNDGSQQNGVSHPTSERTSLLNGSGRRNPFPQRLSRSSARPDRVSHPMHCLICLACCGLWLPCWVGACFGWCCQQPLESAATCCDGCCAPQTPTFDTV
jgi:hypothetical protein